MRSGLLASWRGSLRWHDLDGGRDALASELPNGEEWGQNIISSRVILGGFGNVLVDRLSFDMWMECAVAFAPVILLARSRSWWKLGWSVHSPGAQNTRNQAETGLFDYFKLRPHNSGPSFSGSKMHSSPSAQARVCLQKYKERMGGYIQHPPLGCIIRRQMPLVLYLFDVLLYSSHHVVERIGRTFDGSTNTRTWRDGFGLLEDFTGFCF